MELKESMTVKIEDAEFIFEQPTFLEFLKIKEFENMSFDAQTDYINSKLKEIKNVSFKGKSVTAEDLKAKTDLPFTLQIKLNTLWVKGIYSECGLNIQVEAEEGNEQSNSEDS